MKVIIFLLLFSVFAFYSAFVYTSGTEAKHAVASAEAIAGKQLYQEYNCTSCHQLYGLGGYLGPDLTTVISQPNKGAGYVRAILKTGTGLMPDLKLNETEIHNLGEFLKYADQTAKTNRQ